MEYFVTRVYKYHNDDSYSYFAYIGDSDDSSIILGIEVGNEDSSRMFSPLKGTRLVGFSDRILEVKRASVSSVLYVRGKPLEVEKSTFSEIIGNIIKTKIDSYNDQLKSIHNNNYSKESNTILDLTLPEKIIRLLNWTDKKTELKFNVKRPQLHTCYKYGVYFAYLGTNIGTEINKLRPVLVWKKHESFANRLNNAYFVFPISSKIPKKKYPYNILVNINGEDNIIRLNEGRKISGLRIIKPLIDSSTKRMYMLDLEKREEVKKAIIEYFN